MVWLLRLYLFPGALSLDPTAGILRRQDRRLLSTRIIEAPAAEWSVYIGYFSPELRQEGVFKRLQLTGPQLDEVLLFTDLKDGESLARGLEAMAPQLGSLKIEVERDAS